jgi:hypothetical protein
MNSHQLHHNTDLYCYKPTTTNPTHIMPPKIPHLLVPSAGSRVGLSSTKSATYTENQQSSTPTYNKPFLLGGETPPSRMSRVTSKVPTRKGSFKSPQGSDPTEGPPEGSQLKRNRGYDDGLQSLGTVSEALKAHAEGQEQGSEQEGEKTSRDGSSRGDRTTVRR